MTEQLLTELKQYCFSLYIGQKVLKYSSTATAIQTIDPYFLEKALAVDTTHLQLRPLSSITDDEAIEVAKMEGLAQAVVTNRTSTYIELKDDSYTLIIQFNGLIKLDKNNNPYHLYSIPTDLLRQKGFATRVYFKGVQYSVDRLVELGIYTLKK